MPLKIWRTAVVRQSSPLTLAALTLSMATAAAWAQDNTTYLDIPQSAEGEAYHEAVSSARIQDELRYIDETSQNLLSDAARPTEARRDRDIYLPTGGGGAGVFIVVALFVIALLLFLKFGAGGTLLRGDPKNAAKKEKPKESWGLKPEDIPTGDLLSRIKAMTDRREALILLLRHCLLYAADATETNFRRADTEREALGRLPQQWPLLIKLRRLLMQTELVHYGGREIDDDAYRSALKDGAEILINGGARGR